MAAVGVDACEKGWIAVALRGHEVEAHFLNGIDELAVFVPDAGAIGIDIPIGIPSEGRRIADIEARSILGARRNSVFFTPVRAALEAPDHRTATRISKDLTGFGISQQAYALRDKIFEVEQWLPSAPCDVREVHPEVSFRYLVGVPASERKKCWAGTVERYKALLGAGIKLGEVDGDAGKQASVDDMLDAAVSAWTAKRIVAGTAVSIPGPPEIAVDGSTVAIWA